MPASAQMRIDGIGRGIVTVGTLRFADGTAAAPSTTFASDTDTGRWREGSGIINDSLNGINVFGLTHESASVYSVKLHPNAKFGWTSGDSTSVLDLVLARDAANTLAQRNGTVNQTSNNYARYVSTTNFNRTASKDISTTLSNVSGATVTATNLIPDGCVLVSVTTSVTTGLGGTTTGYSVGDGVDADRWGTVSAVAAGTDTDNTDWTVTTIQLFTAAQNVVLTALTANFNGTGVIEVHVGCLVGESE